MRVYCIYSFRDSESIKAMDKFDEDLRDNNYRPFRFDSGDRDTKWKATAQKKIEEADLVLFFLSEGYLKNDVNIDFELSVAEKHKKTLLCIPTDDTAQRGREDPFNNLKYKPFKDMSLDDAKQFIRRNLRGEETAMQMFEGKHPESMDIEEQKLLFEQYKEMFASTESLMSRRQNTSSFFISINTALIAMMAAVFALGLDKRLLCLMGIVITVFGMIISKNWKETLESYDRINYSKFNVLEAMERYLPAAMFRAEYKDTKNSIMKRSVPSYSDRERKIPQLFLVLYGFICVTMAAILILHLTDIIQF